MQKLADWLSRIESLAADFYRESAALFPDDKELSELLTLLAGDEEYHLELITGAAEQIKAMGSRPSVIDLDADTKQRTEAPLRDCREKLKDGKLTKDDLIYCVVTTEFSEWNDIFLYVINSLKRSSKEFVPAAAIQQHKRRIERFLGSRPELKGFLEGIKTLPRVWEERILAVDDSETIVDLLGAILDNEGNVVSARNGREALGKLGEGYYAAVITDVEMPVMDGIALYKEAVRRYPHMKERFVFFTSAGDEERTSFFKENGLRYLPKPSPITDIRRAIVEVLQLKN